MTNKYVIQTMTQRVYEACPKSDTFWETQKVVAPMIANLINCVFF